MLLALRNCTLLARIQVSIGPVTRCPRPGSPLPLPALEEGIQVEDILLVLSSAGHVQNLTLALSWSIVSVKTLTTLDTCTQDGREPPDIPKQSAMVSMMLFRCNSPTPGLRYFRREKNKQTKSKQARSKDQTVAI